MQLTKKVTFIISIIVISLNYRYLVANQDSTQKPCEILFIGSSYFSYNNLLALFQNLSDSSGRDVYIDQQITVGYLADHADRTSTESKINEKNPKILTFCTINLLLNKLKAKYRFSNTWKNNVMQRISKKLAVSPIEDYSTI